MCKWSGSKLDGSFYSLSPALFPETPDHPDDEAFESTDGFSFGFPLGDASSKICAMKFVSSQGGPKVPADAAVTSTVGIGPRSEGGFGLDIALEVSLPGLARADAEALVAKAHQVCPYSNATRNNVDVRLTVV